MSMAERSRDQDDARRLMRRLSFHRRLSLFMILAASIPYAILARQWLQENTLRTGLLMEVDGSAPHAEEVADLIRPLRYSIAPILLRPDVRIDLDFANRKWHIRNLHRFDDHGRIVLEQGRYGVCGELSAYAYDRLKQIFEPERYALSLIRVAESGFFPRLHDGALLRRGARPIDHPALRVHP
jgi:hypothetical protein